MFLPLALLTILCLFLTTYIIRHLRHQKLSKHLGCAKPRRYPQLDPFFGLDTFLQTILATLHDRQITLFASRFTQSGPTFSMQSPTGTKLYTIDPENLAVMYGAPSTTGKLDNRPDTDGGPHWGLEPVRLAAMEPFCGRGFVTTDGEDWVKARAALKPCFARRNVADLGWYMGLVDGFVAGLPNGETVDLVPLLDDLFLENSFKFIFGKPLSELSRTTEAEVTAKDFLAAFQRAMTGAGIRVVLGSLRWLYPTRQWKKDCAIVHRFVDEFIQNELQEREKGHNRNGKSLIHHLLSQTNDKVEIRGHVIQAMMSTSDTTAVLLANTFFLLSRHAEIWTDFVQEVRNIPMNIDFNDLKGLRSAYNILHESLRLYPILPTLGRTALHTTTLPRGGVSRPSPSSSSSSPILIPAGTSCTNSFFALHRNPTVFPAPESFMPSRWDSNASIKPGAYEYMPFGGGTRRCPGEEKAMVEATYFLVAMARRFGSVESRDQREWRGRAKLSARNVGGCLVTGFEG